MLAGSYPRIRALFREGDLIFVCKPNVGILNPPDFVAIGKTGLDCGNVPQGRNEYPKRDPQVNRWNPVPGPARCDVKKASRIEVDLARDIHLIGRIRRWRMAENPERHVQVEIGQKKCHHATSPDRVFGKGPARCVKAGPPVYVLILRNHFYGPTIHPTPDCGFGKVL